MEEKQQLTKINLGKINDKRVREVISNLTWKGKSRKELNSYLDWTSKDYKESETILTDLFGKIDPKIINFLEDLYKKYNFLIDETNFKDFIREVETFSNGYEYQVVNLRKTKEELLKRREESEKYQKDEELKRKLEEEELHKEGQLTKSEKINLGTKEITKKIRDQIKKEFKDCVFSVSFDSYSGGSSISIKLRESNFRVGKDGNYNINHHHLRDEYNESKTDLTEEGFNMFKRINEMVSYYNYDDSDTQTDYFSVNFYYDLSVGSYDKPYIFKEAEK